MTKPYTIIKKKSQEESTAERAVMWLAWESDGAPFPFYAPSNWSMEQAFEFADKIFGQIATNKPYFVTVCQTPIAKTEESLEVE